jgi:hypothetical protein
VDDECVQRLESWAERFSDSTGETLKLRRDSAFFQRCIHAHNVWVLAIDLWEQSKLDPIG